MEIRPQSATLYDVVSFISLAAVLGLITGICLGGFALLLAAPAYGAETKGEAPVFRARRESSETAGEEVRGSPGRSATCRSPS
jgi:hypothetical protein